MFNRFRVHAGLHVAIAIAILTSIPRLIRLENVDMIHTFYQMCYSFFFSMVIWLICEFFINNKHLKKRITKIALSILTGMVASYFLLNLSNYLFNDIAFDNKQIGVIFNLSELQQFYLHLFKGFSFSALIYFIAHNISLIEEKQKNLLEIEQLKQENLEARLSLLKQQVSPHFLFNSLSTLKTIAPDSNTKNFVMQLSNVYRYLLKDNGYQNSNLVSLKEELEFTQSYLYILSERFEEALQVEINVEDSQMQNLLPPLALQILIENAIKHNVVCIDEPLQIKIYTKDNFLRVSNKVQLKQSMEDSLGIGLQNIKDRYKLLENKDIEIESTNNTFTVDLPLIAAEQIITIAKAKPAKNCCNRKK